ncbi:hypothetical protein [Gordonia caeni]|uniref:Uncharacterized protein n=1 Tax=Gordonia caeni TaxID=1007097 RepID=A0ABP7PGV1_9ACTN
MSAPDPSLLPRLRAVTVGAVGTGTGVSAHAQGHGALPDGSGLLVIAAAGLALGLVAGRTGTTAAAPWRLLPLLAGGQLLVHFLLIALTGHHHQLITTPMAAMHTVGTLAALGLIVAAERLVRAVAGLARSLAALCTPIPVAVRAVPAVLRTRVVAPQPLRHLGTVGTRGPPVLV